MAPTLQSDTRSEVKSRRPSKHLTERKRRARMNDSLLQLKAIVFPSVKHEVGQSSKLEKNDILDMTLRYVKDVQQKHREGKEPTVDQFHAGYSECLSQVSNFLGSCDAMSLETRRRLLTHLSNRSLTVSNATPARQTSPQPPASVTPPQMPQCLPIEHRVPAPQVFPAQRVVYLVPAQAIQPVAQTSVQPLTHATIMAQQSSPLAAPGVPVISFMPTPPNSPISPSQGSPTGFAYQTVLPEPTAPVKRTLVPMATISPALSSAEDQSAMWRPW